MELHVSQPESSADMDSTFDTERDSQEVGEEEGIRTGDTGEGICLEMQSQQRLKG